MALKYTQVPTDAFQHIQINAGIILTEFNPLSPTIDKTKIIGATTGGIEFASEPEYIDYGEDIDNVPINTKQLKRLSSINATMSGSFVSVNEAAAKLLVGAADSATTTEGVTAVIPRTDLNYGTLISTSSEATPDDFTTLWFVGDYSDFNSGTNAGFIAIKLENALNSTGFSLQSSKDEKGEFSFEFQGHYDLNNVDKVPYEIYIKAGDPSNTIKVEYTTLRNHLVLNGSTYGTTTGILATDREIPEGASIIYMTYPSGIVTVQQDANDPVKSTITAVSAGSTYITALIQHTPTGPDDPVINYGTAQAQIIVTDTE